jgi:hypothetical protein
MKELVREARAVSFDIFQRGRERLEAGGDSSAIHRVVVASQRCLEDIEAYALLAGSPNREAEIAVDRLISRLRVLRAELEDYAG